jgi:tRNA pseudouridine65 synthase
MRPLSILYLDDCLVAVNKPAGLLVHRSALDRYETENAMHLLRDQLGRWVYPLHRLDKATSGVLVFALDRETARRMMPSFAGRNVSKTYLAVVRGFTGEEGRIDHPLRERRGRMPGQGAEGNGAGKEAVTEYRRLATIEFPHPVGRYATARYSLLMAAPLTGRMHQLRRHLKHIFHPVVGDTTYGDGRQNEFIRNRFQCRRLLLHARELSFLHPSSGQPVRLQAPLDQAFGALLEAFSWGNVPL